MRLDKDGRDVTDLPGLWDESDRHAIDSSYCGNCKHGFARGKHLILCSIDDDKNHFVWHSCRQWTPKDEEKT